MKLLPITPEAASAPDAGTLEVAKPVLGMFAQLYNSGGYRPPWIGYLAREDGSVVGTCAFKGAPADSRVEIAYYTFPGHEGQGVATRMVEGLLALIAAEDPSLTVAAQTLPAHGASTRILQKHGFLRWADVQHPEDGLVWEWRRDARRSESALETPDVDRGVRSDGSGAAHPDQRA